MTIRGAGGKLIASVITNIGETLPHLPKIATTVFSAIYPGEIYPVDTTTPHEKFSYCAVHKGIWNRYSEQGTDAPEGVHPFQLIREDVSRANVTQRAPLPSREMKDEPEESALTAEFIQLLVSIVEIHMRKRMPEEYTHVRVWATRLPLNQRSDAFPFGGYVINFAACTEGHRDEFDDEYCVVLVDGEWEGGELGFFEPGFLFRLRRWNAIIFRSCEVTHFNMHMNGVRISIVLHSDKEGKKWVADKNKYSS
ncbi:hypothetical protein B0H14DRAFT_2374187 [Mycena olivaceomarginata]|nr:hypothetical protein B0H14DRAFT_2374187 [Mycena olivaceomarginata]